jgi:endogenous inhibitor of DNA gyrase (YacG/DUF329 family)
VDLPAVRIIKRARDTLVDGLNLSAIVRADASLEDRAAAVGHGLSAEQFDVVARVTHELWALMVDDPAPPDCVNCATPITHPAIGRPRRFCSDACRQADYRDRLASERSDEQA